MMDSQILPAAPAQAAQAGDCYQAALAYHTLGFSVLPLKGKRPTLKNWKENQTRRASTEEIEAWNDAQLFENVGIVCGEVSGNLAVLDLDGVGACVAFAALFPEIAQTYTVTTGSGKGRHLYLYVDALPTTVKAMDTPIGNLELRGDGCQVAAPPSIHPDTGKQYIIAQDTEILRVPNLDAVVGWIEAFKMQQSERLVWKPPRDVALPDPHINSRVIEAIAGNSSRGNTGCGESGSTARASTRRGIRMETAIPASGLAPRLVMGTATPAARCPPGRCARRWGSTRQTTAGWSVRPGSCHSSEGLWGVPRP